MGKMLDIWHLVFIKVIWSKKNQSNSFHKIFPESLTCESAKFGKHIPDIKI